MTLACSGLAIMAGTFTRPAAHFPNAYLFAMFACGAFLVMIGAVTLLMNRASPPAASKGASGRAANR